MTNGHVHDQMHRLRLRPHRFDFAPMGPRTVVSFEVPVT